MRNSRIIKSSAFSMTSTTILLHVLLILTFLSTLPTSRLTPTIVAGNNVMLTNAFVDIYDTTGTGVFIVATSDGGAAFTSYNGGTVRVVKMGPTSSSNGSANSVFSPATSPPAMRTGPPQSWTIRRM